MSRKTWNWVLLAVFAVMFLYNGAQFGYGLEAALTAVMVTAGVWLVGLLFGAGRARKPK